jgi:hypothetical protein
MTDNIKDPLSSFGQDFLSFEARERFISALSSLMLWAPSILFKSFLYAALKSPLFFHFIFREQTAKLLQRKLQKNCYFIVKP